MTNDPPNDRIDPETLAAYVDGRLTAEERARVEARIAADEDSYEWLVEVMRTQAALASAAGGRTRRWYWLAGSVSAAAALILAVQFVSFRSASPDSDLSPLLAAVNGERYVEPRLTGGFPAGAIRSTTRGTDPGSQNLSLLAAAAEAQRRAQEQPTARNLHAWGVAALLLGNLDDAIDALEAAAAEDTANAALMADLAAAYAVRARQSGDARDWSNALDRSDRAIRLDPAALEPYFNRALALESLGLDSARAAWQSYLDRDGTSDWAAEAREHLSRLSARPQGSRRPANEARLQAALAGGGDLEAAVRQDPQRAREWLEEDLTREWAHAVVNRDAPAEMRVRTHAERLLAAYHAVSADALPGDAVRHLWSRVHDRAAVAAAAALFVDAAAAVREDRLSDSTALAARALPALRSSESPLAWWARYYVALDRTQQGRFEEALPELDAIGRAAEARGYTALGAAVRNRRGVIFGRQGNQEGAIRERLAAIALCESAADVDQIAAMHALIAEAYRLLGDVRAAWRHHGESLRRLEDVPNYRSRHQVLVQAGLTSTFEGRLDAANAFQQQVIDNGRAWQRASGTSTGLLQRARNSFRLGRIDDAEAAIRDARALAAEITDAPFRDRLEQEILGVEAEVFGSREPGVGLPMLDAAVERFSRRGMAVRLSNLLLSRGRLHLKAGDAHAAEADWQRAVEALEAERATVSAESLRLAQAGSLRLLQGEIAFARVRGGRSGDESLAPIEHGRARTLVEAALKVAVPSLDLARLRERLDAGTGLVHYAIGDAAAVAWVTTAAGTTAVPLPVASDALAVLVDRHRRLSARGGAADVARASARELYAVLIAPLGARLAPLTSLIVVPDPALAGVSFGALIDPVSGRYLIESMSVAMAPSATLLSATPPPAAKSAVLLVGADRPRDMPALPWVSAELERLAKVHPDARRLSGGDATRERLLAEAPRASIIHVAGHAFASPANPLLSRLVLHPGADGRADLYAYELSAVDVAGAVVVLAACQTGYAGGVADDDGVLAMARPFLARGARAVIATYRDVSDSGAPELMERLHRQLKNGLTPSRAWRATALDTLRTANPSPEWTAYAVFLGRGSLDPPRPPATDDTSGGIR